MGGRRQASRIRGEQRRSPRREGSGFGDTREGMKEEIGGKGREWERTLSLRSSFLNTKVGGDGATRPKRGHKLREEGWRGPAVWAQTAMGVQRLGAQGQRNRAPREQRLAADRPRPELQEAAEAWSADPCRPPTRLPAGPCARLSPGPPLPSAACPPASPDSN